LVHKGISLFNFAIMTKGLLFLIFIHLAVFDVCAQNPLKVLLYNDIKVVKATVSFTGDDFKIEADDLHLLNFNASDTFQISINKGKIALKTQVGTLGNFHKLKFIANNHQSLIRLQPLPILRIFNDYPQMIEISIHAGKLRFINTVEMEDYLTGVLKGEAGLDRPVELYKVHAVISRTYAWKNKSKHRAEGLNLCDQVHCQVYKGYWGNYEPIQEGVAMTKSEIIEDNNQQAIDALFHSNCGGQTLNSEDVWSEKLSYCRSKPDSFCHFMKNAEWTITMSNEAFKAYLHKNFYVTLSLNDTDTVYLMQSVERQKYWHINNQKISMKQMRADLELKSAYFDIYQIGSEIQLLGKGFGHGVGLCQEGAICMAEYGHDYQQIIKHYYEGVLIKKRIK